VATREIDETEFLAAKSTIDAVNGMLAHPAARKLLLQARKTADPNVVIPEIDAAAPLNSEMSEIKKMLAEEKAAREAEKVEREQAVRISEFQQGWERQKSRLREAGWRDEGISEVEKFAQERGVPDLEIAASHWEKLHPPPEPVQPNGSGSWGFFDQPADDDMFVKKMIDSRGEDESALNQEINAALKEYRSQQSAVRR
jgi:hypothetical protein